MAEHPGHGQPIRLVILIQDMEFGGTQRYVAHLLHHLDRNQFEPELWLLRGGEGMIPYARQSGARILWMSKRMWIGPVALLKMFCYMARERPPVLYTITGNPNGWGRLFGRLLKLPIVISGYRSLVPRAYERWFWRLSDHIICNANASKQMLIESSAIEPKRVSVIPNGVDADYFRPSSEPKTPHPSVVCVGRWVFEKDPLTLVEAFRLTLKKVPDATLEMIGGGYLQKNVAKAIHEKGLETSVVLIPEKKDILPHLHRAWAFTLASVRESSPNAVLEAMATGLPVVSTRVGGIPEIVGHGKTGLIVEPNNPKQLADALIEVLTNRSKRATMALEARKRVMEQHSIPVMIRRTEAVILQTVNKTRKGMHTHQHTAL